MGQLLGGIEWDPRAQPNVVFVLLLGHITDAPQYHVAVGDVPGFLDAHVLEQTSACSKDVVHTGFHLIAMTEHTPRPDIPFPWDILSNEVLHHILQYLCRHRCCNCLAAFVTLR